MLIEPLVAGVFTLRFFPIKRDELVDKLGTLVEKILEDACQLLNI